jgi:hypothetical protein
MKKILQCLLVVFGLFLSGMLFAQDKELEYQVYSQVLSEYFTPAPGTVLKIVSKTAGYILVESAVNSRCRDTIPHELIERYNALNAAKYKVEDKFAFPNDIHHEIINTTNGIALSKIAFNEKRNECLLYIDDNRWGLPTKRHSYVYRLKKEDNTWKAVNRCRLL